MLMRTGVVRGRIIATLVMLLVIVGLSWPMLTTSSAMSQDWPNHLWYMWRQSLTIRSDGLPSMFLHAGGAVFYPFYGFYGGSLYSLGGAVSLLLGNAPVKAYILTWMFGFAAAYGGLYWLARMAGVGRWLSHAPALVYVTSPYVLTLIYARGAWPEFMATSAIPLFVAASVRALRSGPLIFGPSLALALSTIVLTGSHNITLLWGSTFMVLVIASVIVFIPSARGMLASRNVLRWLLVVVPSALVNAWVLLPSLAYGSRIRVGSADWSVTLRLTSVLTSVGRLLTLSRGTSVTTGPGISYAPDFSLALPVLAIAWILLCAGLVLRHRTHPDNAGFRCLLGVCVGVGLLFGLLLIDWHLIEDLPGPYHLVQFPYRLETYVLLAVSGAMICILAMQRSQTGGRRGARALLVVVLAFATIGAGEQEAHHANQFPDRNFVFDARQQPPASVYDTGDYSDVTLPVVTAVGPALADFPPDVHQDRVHATLAVEPSQTLVQSNIRAAPYLVRVLGATVAGRSQGGFMVLRLPVGHARLVSVVVERATSTPIALGRALSLIGILALLALGFAGAVRARRRRVARTSELVPTPQTAGEGTL
ncbi:MAG TPA: hypothetical protein VGX72_13425 [Solirubrobacteraceae bacterium]|nr:hypothetical protein [Solirubrobacteraceae bacterium]